MVQPRIQPLVFYRVFLVGFCMISWWHHFLYPVVALYCWLMKDSWHTACAGTGRASSRSSFPVPILDAPVVFRDHVLGNVRMRYNFSGRLPWCISNEVLGNIWQSYNIPLLSSSIFSFMTILLLYFFRKRLIAVAGK